MNGKLIRDFAILVAIFGVIWLAFTYFPIFPKDFNPELSFEDEQELGDLMVDKMQEYNPAFRAVDNYYVDSSIAIITDRLMAGIDSSDYEYRIQVVNNPQINAITLPGGNILIFKGLIEFAETPEEVAAVLAHEIGHVEKRHVVKKLIKEFGLNILFSVVTGNDGIILGELGKTALSSVFDRKQEREADEFALQLMEKASIHPKCLASFFRKINREKGNFSENFEIVMSHPHNNSRIKTSLEYIPLKEFEEVPLDLDWEEVQKQLD